jgi:hypothetical protein
VPLAQHGAPVDSDVPAEVERDDRVPKQDHV